MKALTTASMAMGLGVLVVAAGPVWSSEEPAAPAKGACSCAKSPDDHLALAQSYDQTAAEHRAVAAEHRKMIADTKEDARSFPNKTGIELGWVRKMREHCEAYITKAEAAAKEAERFAEYHRMRAAELQGR